MALITIFELARINNISPKTMKTMAANQSFPLRMVDGSRMTDPEEFETWLDDYLARKSFVATSKLVAERTGLGRNAAGHRLFNPGFPWLVLTVEDLGNGVSLKKLFEWEHRYQAYLNGHPGNKTYTADYFLARSETVRRYRSRCYQPMRRDYMSAREFGETVGISEYQAQRLSKRPDAPVVRVVGETGAPHTMFDRKKAVRWYRSLPVTINGADIAKNYGIPPSRAYALIRSGDFPASRVKKEHYRIDAKKADDWMARHGYVKIE